MCELLETGHRCMTVVNTCRRWLPLGTLILVVMTVIISGACSGDGSGSTMEPPFQGLDRLVELSELSIIGKVEAVSEVQTIPHPRDPTSQIEYLEATVEVDRILFGSHYSRLAVHVPLYYLAGNGHRMVTRDPILEPGDTVMLFLTQRDSLFDLDGRDFVITGGGMLWGKLTVEGERVSVPYPASKPGPEPLDDVAAWIEAARLSLAKPGLLAGEVSGLDEGDSATIRLLYLGRSHREENGVEVAQWTMENGPWEQSGLRLSQGTYILVPKAEDYLPRNRTGGLMFEVPTEGMDWRERNLGFAFFRPKGASDKPLSTGTGWIPERSVGGWIAGLPDGAVATVRIQRLLPVPNELYVIGPPLPEDTSLYYPQELTCLEEGEDHLVPEETVAEIEVRNGRWGLSDHALAGHRYLITLRTSDASGIRVGNAGYVAVVFGGKAPHLLREVDFYVGDSADSYCDSNPSCTVACSEILRPPDNLAIQKVVSGAISTLYWEAPDQDAVTCEFQRRFGDVPYWVHLGSTSSDAFPSHAPFRSASRHGTSPSIAIEGARLLATQHLYGPTRSATT